VEDNSRFYEEAFEVATFRKNIGQVGSTSGGGRTFSYYNETTPRRVTDRSDKKKSKVSPIEG